MTDTTTTIDTPTGKGGKTKATLAGAYIMLCTNIIPVIVGYFCAHYPKISEATWYEIVSLALSGLGTAAVWATPQHFVEAITRFIRFGKTTWKQWATAWQTPV